MQRDFLGASTIWATLPRRTAGVGFEPTLSRINSPMYSPRHSASEKVDRQVGPETRLHRLRMM